MQQFVWYESKNGVMETSRRVTGGEATTFSVHMVGSLYAQNQRLLTDGTLFIKQATVLVKRLGAQKVGEKCVQFEPIHHQQSGYSAALILAESHITVHTWPESGMVEIDVYLCNVLRDNRSKCRKIFRGVVHAFKPTRVYYTELQRPVFELGSTQQIHTKVVAPRKSRGV